MPRSLLFVFILSLTAAAAAAGAQSTSAQDSIRLTELLKVAAEARNAGDSAQLDATRILLADHYRQDNRLPEAVQHYRQAIAGYLRRGAFPEAANQVARLSSTYRRLGLSDQATEAGYEAIALAERSEDAAALTLATRTLAFTMLMRDRLDSALILANEAVTAAERHGHPQSRIPAYGTRATIHNFRGEAELALRDFQVVRSMEGNRPRLATLSNMAALYMKLDRREEARDYYQKAMAQARETSNLTALQQIYRGMAMVDLDAAQRDTVDHYIKLHNLLRDSLQGIEAREEVLELEEKYAAAEREAEIALQASQLDRKNTQLYATIGGLVLALIAGTIFYVLAGKLRRRNAQNEELVAEKQALIGEIHHRVKNNLQVISSLLSLQGRQLAGAGAKDALRASRARVEAMGMIHQRLYHGEEVTTVYLPEYLRDLSESLIDTYRLDERVELACRVDSIHLDVDKAISLGLIVNELITNSLKYAFPGEREGRITVAVRELAGSELELTVSDDGVGQAAAPTLKSSTSFGTELIDMLAKKLGATIQRPNGRGYTTRLRFAGE